MAKNGNSSHEVWELPTVYSSMGSLSPKVWVCVEHCLLAYLLLQNHSQYSKIAFNSKFQLQCHCILNTLYLWTCLWFYFFSLNNGIKGHTFLLVITSWCWLICYLAQWCLWFIWFHHLKEKSTLQTWRSYFVSHIRTLQCNMYKYNGKLVEVMWLLVASLMGKLNCSNDRTSQVIMEKYECIIVWEERHSWFTCVFSQMEKEVNGK